MSETKNPPTHPLFVTPKEDETKLEKYRKGILELPYAKFCMLVGMTTIVVVTLIVGICLTVYNVHKVNACSYTLWDKPNAPEWCN